MAQALSVEETNHLRAVYLCYKVAPDAVRAYFDTKHPPPQLVNNLAAEKSNLQKIKGKVLKQYQWDQLYPSAGLPLPASSAFDITLLICLLRNMNPVIPQPPFGFDKLPSPSQNCDGANVARIKYYRNSLAHSKDGKLSNTGFTDLSRDLDMAIQSLGGISFVSEVNNAKTISLDNTSAEILRQMTEFEKQNQELLNGVINNLQKFNTLKTEMGNLNTEQLSMKGEYEHRLADLTKEIKQQEDKMADISSRVIILEGHISKIISGTYKLIYKNKKLSYTVARGSIVSRLKLVSNGLKLGLHSMRSGGATAAATSDINDRVWKRHVRWKRDSSKDGYIVDSVDKKGCRCGNHRSAVETGRWHNISRNDRLCHLCDSNDIGVEFHYAMTCTVYER